jgi:hypothetical protein
MLATFFTALPEHRTNGDRFAELDQTKQHHHQLMLFSSPQSSF